LLEYLTQLTVFVYLDNVIWKLRYPAINEASFVRDCLPEPPTPTSKALPMGVYRIRAT